jgi:large subunit ribosomal protein L13Ae
MHDKIVIDGRGHLLGRLASIVAKQLLSGQHLIVVRCEEIVISGGLVRQKMKYERFLRKTHNSNPRRCGPIHYRAPARIFSRVVRGMMPHKTHRGSAAFDRLRCFEGLPGPFDKMKRMIVPDALKVLRKAHSTAVVKLGLLSHSVGWKHSKSVENLEFKRRKCESDYIVAKKKLLTSLYKTKALMHVKFYYK